MGKVEYCTKNTYNPLASFTGGGGGVGSRISVVKVSANKEAVCTKE